MNLFTLNFCREIGLGSKFDSNASIVNFFYSRVFRVHDRILEDFVGEPILD